MDSSIQDGWTLTGKWQTDSRNLRPLGSYLRSCLRESGKSCGTRLSRVQENLRLQHGQKAKEILMGDEFSMIILLYHVAFWQNSILDVLWWSLMIHTLEVLYRSWTYPVMYRDTIFMIEICPDMYHDTVSLSVSSRFCPAFCVSAVARALPWCCLVFRTHASLPTLSLKIRCRKCSM